MRQPLNLVVLLRQMTNAANVGWFAPGTLLNHNQACEANPARPEGMPRRVGGRWLLGSGLIPDAAKLS
jgi:hypothetical protein